jgi:ABC-type multidrug transport system ATPase subunit
VFGFNPEKNPLQIRARTGYMMQETSVDLYLSGREKLELQAALYNWHYYMRRRLEVAIGTLNPAHPFFLPSHTLT